MKASRFQYDLAYGCYLFCGLAALILSAMDAGFPSHDVVVGMSFMLVILAVPLMVAVCGAILVGVVLSLLHWKHWPFPVLGAMSVLLIVTTLFTDFVSTKLISIAVTALYGIIVVVFSGMWFMVYRRRCFPAAVKE